MNKIFVIAGNYEQFRRFRFDLIQTMIDEDIPFQYQDIIYLDSFEKVRGFSELWGYRVGTWYERKDLQQLELLLLTSRSSIDEFIEVEL